MSEGTSADDDWDRRARHETRQQRLDRNFAEMLQELRVAQTGVQILFAFLLTVAFSAGFRAVTGPGLVIYSVTVLTASLATCFLIAPVACHRLLFRRRAKERLVDAAQRFTLVGLGLLGLSVVGALTIVLQVAVGWTWAVPLVLAVAAAFVAFWVVVPLTLRDDPRARADVGPDEDPGAGARSRREPGRFANRRLGTVAEARETPGLRR